MENMLDPSASPPLTPAGVDVDEADTIVLSTPPDDVGGTVVLPEEALGLC